MSSYWQATVALAALVTAMRVITGFAPVRWVWKRLVHDPVQEGLRAVVQEELKPMLDAALGELRPNHGSSFRDAVDRVGSNLKEFMAYQHSRNHDLINQGMSTQGKILRIEAAVSECREQIAEVRGQVEEVQRHEEQIAADMSLNAQLDELARNRQIERRDPDQAE